jgi:hypothetical protein
MTNTAPTVTSSWVVGRQGVNAFERRCLELGWVFHETPQQSDFGKDGYVDFTHNTTMTGPCVAVQIKGGRSFRNSDGYNLRASDSQRRFWEMSTVPVFGIVWDPDSNGLHWCDITGTLRKQGYQAQLHASRCNELNSTEGAASFKEYAIACSIAGPVALALASDDPLLQVAAVEDTQAFGKRDPRYFVLLRRTMFALHEDALDHAIYVLGKLTMNPDAYFDKLWFGMTVCQDIRRQFRWTVSEAILLLGRIENDGVNRATFGQNIYWLIVGDDNWDYVSIVQEATILAATLGNEHAAGWDLYLSVFWAAEHGERRLDEFLKRQPLLKFVWSYEAIRDLLAKDGRVEIAG